MQVRTTKRFEFVDETTNRLTRVPAGWTGELSGNALDEARKAGALDEAYSRTAAPKGDAEGAPEGAAKLEDMTKAELEAEAKRRNVDLTGANTKAEIIEKLKA
ncbi:hypothetical protein [Rhodoligotrophos ferricapiens]|uniref:hypothetical protein n=1 Tax=Rhodoligotrophos ferricapiens TaxID=3069264 RepID=UPI00315D95D1